MSNGAIAARRPGPNQYRCEMCQGIFDLGWSDDEAQKEAFENGFDPEDCGLVCDDCYKLTPWGKP